MQFLLFSNSWSAGFSSAGFLIAIALLACILGAEIAGICILISKMQRARRAKYEASRESEEDSRNYALLPVVLLGVIPQSTVVTLTALAVLTAIGAVVFLVLLIAFRLCGYDFAVLRREEAHEETAEEPASVLSDEERINEDSETVESEEDLWATDTYADEGDEQRQEEYTAFGEDEDEEPLSVFAEEEDFSEESADAASDESVVTEVLPAVVESTVMPAEGEPAFADGTRPYKVVEKVVTETYKEVYKETPPAQQGSGSSSTDAVMEKLADFLEYELQKRKESDAAEAEGKSEKNDSVPTFASADGAYDEEDADDEDDLEEDDLEENESADGKKREDDEDSDDEENDNDDRFTGNERIIGFDEETGCYIVAHYRKSFEAKLIQSRPNIKKYYSELKNALLSYKGTKNRISWTADSFHNGRTPIAKINVKTRILELYLALDPASLEGTVYRGTDVSNIKKYVDTPFRYKLRTPRKFKWAMELIQRTCEEHGLSPIDIERVDYEAQYPFDTTENLVTRGLIKEYIRQEKPATSFELAPDHVPSVPDEDESVIPANANFSWEFDNEMLIEQEPVIEPEQEIVPEPEPTPEPTPEPEPTPAPEAQPTIVRETVKVTEMRYTERYYADAAPSYEQVVTTTEPIEAEAIPADATVETVVEEEADAYEVPASEERAETEEMTDEAIDAEEVDIWGGLNDTAEAPEAVAEEEITEEAIDESAEEESEELFFDGEANATEEYTEESAEESATVLEDMTEETEEVDTEEQEAAEDTVEEAVETDTYETLSEPAAVVHEEPVSAPEAEPVRKRIVNPGVAVVDICSLEEYFEQDAVIRLESLKILGLVLPTANVLKIYASGPISKSFTVEANHFTLDAIKAISDADGDAVMVR